MVAIEKKKTPVQRGPVRIIAKVVIFDNITGQTDRAWGKTGCRRYPGHLQKA